MVRLLAHLALGVRPPLPHPSTACLAMLSVAERRVQRSTLLLFTITYHDAVQWYSDGTLIVSVVTQASDKFSSRTMPFHNLLCYLIFFFFFFTSWFVRTQAYSGDSGLKLSLCLEAHLFVSFYLSLLLLDLFTF